MACPLVQIQTRMLRIYKNFVALLQNQTCATTSFSLRKNIWVACPLVEIQTHILRICNKIVALLLNPIGATTIVTLRYSGHNVAFLPI